MPLSDLGHRTDVILYPRYHKLNPFARSARNSMDYQLIKPLILRVVAESRIGARSVPELVQQIHTLIPDEQSVAALRNKIGWAVRELKNEGAVVRTAKGNIKLTKRVAKQKRLVLTCNSNALTGRLFEEECKRVLSHFRFTKLRLTGKTGDRGVDGEASFCICKELTLKFAIQCKGGGKKVSSPQVREFIGSIAGTYAGGIVFSSAGFTEEALAVARKLKQPPVYLLGKEIISQYYTHKYTSSGDA